MKTSTIWSKGLLLLTVSFLVLLTISGCKKDDNPVDATETIPNNLFPLVLGHTIIYGEGTLLFTDTDNPITGSEIGFNSRWLVAMNLTQGVPPPHTTATLLLDTTKLPALGATSVRQFLIYQDASGNFDFVTNLGYLFRSQKIYKTPGDPASGPRSDSTQWISLAKVTEGLKKEYVCYSANYTSATLGPIKFEIVGEFTEKATVTIAGTSLVVYKLVATRKIYLGTSTVAVNTAKTAELWLSPGIGPVYIELRGDAESPGKRQQMTSKSF